MKYSFVIPVYNERINIESAANEIRNKFDSYSKDYEILFVDDNSPDGTGEEVMKLALKDDRIKLFQHGKKNGLGAAIKYGYLQTQGQFIIGIDVDLSQSVDDLLKMIRFMKNNKADMVIGSRYTKGGKQINKPWVRDFASKSMNYLVSKILRMQIYDLSHTFRVFDRKIIDNIKNLLVENGHPSFMTEFTYFAKKKNFKILEYPIIFIERDASKGVSKLSVTKEIPSYLKFILKLIRDDKIK